MSPISWWSVVWSCCSREASPSTPSGTLLGLGLTAEDEDCRASGSDDHYLPVDGTAACAVEASKCPNLTFPEVFVNSVATVALLGEGTV